VSESAKTGGSLIDEIVRDGARRMLAAALEAEVAAYIAAHAAELDEQGRRLVVLSSLAVRRPRDALQAHPGAGDRHGRRSGMAALMLTSGRLPVETVYDLLVQAGHYEPAPEVALVLPVPDKPAVSRPAPPPMVFSNPGDVNDPVFPVVPSQRRRTAKAIQDGRRGRRSR
jgi:hypothetical protein